jgi:hypothetical protein
MSFPNQRTYTFDADAQLSDNAAAYTATGFTQVLGVDGIIDIGGNQGASSLLPPIADISTYTPQSAPIAAMLVLDVTALKISSGNETYKVQLLVSNDPNFGAASAVCAAAIEIGKGASLDGVNIKDSVTGRYEVGFTNNVAGSFYQYAKLHVTESGTTPSINILAFVVVLPEPYVIPMPIHPACVICLAEGRWSVSAKDYPYMPVCRECLAASAARTSGQPAISHSPGYATAPARLQ